jgi:iron only hydrogenase large subunit-like protein
MTASPHVPVSWGELIDKITILEIKTQRLSDETARANARKELRLLQDIAGEVLTRKETEILTARLRALNLALWEIEDGIREHERAGDFGPAFVELARSVYRRNDERGQLKREINLALGSELIEEKSYRPY